MAVKKHWSEVLACSLCGRRFRNYQAEAWHRHNARFVCKGYPKDKDETNELRNEQVDRTEPKAD